MYGRLLLLVGSTGSRRGLIGYVMPPFFFYWYAGDITMGGLGFCRDSVSARLLSVKRRGDNVSTLLINITLDLFQRKLDILYTGGKCGKYNLSITF